MQITSQAVRSHSVAFWPHLQSICQSTSSAVHIFIWSTLRAVAQFSGNLFGSL